MSVNLTEISPSKTQAPGIEQIREEAKVLEANFLAALESFDSVLRTLGAPVGIASPNLVKRFNGLEVGVRIKVINEIQNTEALYRELLSSGGLLQRDREISVLKTFLKKVGLRPADESFYDLINEGDLIEIYNMDFIQIFRSWTFFSVCSYSLGELLVFPFMELFSRPSWILEQIMRVIKKVLEPEYSVVPYDIPEYALDECLPGHINTFLFRQKYCVVLLDKDGRPAGLLCNGRAKLRALPRTKENIAYI